MAPSADFSVSPSRPVRVLLDGTAIPADLGGVGRYVDDLVPELSPRAPT